MQLSYPTLFVCYVAIGILYAAVMWVITFRTPQLHAHRWFTWAVTAGLLRIVLMTTFGHAPLFASVLAPALLNIASFYCGYQGYRWAIIQRPEPHPRWHAFLYAETAALAMLFLLKVPHLFALSILPVLALAGMSIHILLRNRRPDLRGASIAGVLVLSAHLLLITLRTPYVAVKYGFNSNAYSNLPTPDTIGLSFIAAMMLTSACAFLVYLWFYEIELHRVLRLQATTDPKTGALNVRALNEEGERLLARALSAVSRVSVLAVDLDAFKLLNDTHGHAAGDEVLQQIVRCMTTEVRTGDIVARTGGEEFVVLLPETGLDEARHIAERIRHCIEKLNMRFEGEHLRATISVGVSESSGPADRWSSLLRRADIALYAAKRNGRNRVEFLHADIPAQA